MDDLIWWRFLYSCKFSFFGGGLCFLLDLLSFLVDLCLLLCGQSWHHQQALFDHLVLQPVSFISGGKSHFLSSIVFSLLIF